MKRLTLDARESLRGDRSGSDSRDGLKRHHHPPSGGANRPGIGSRFRELAGQARVILEVGAAEGFFSLSLLRRNADPEVCGFAAPSELSDLLACQLEIETDSVAAFEPVLLKIEVEGEEIELLEEAREVLDRSLASVMVKVHDRPTESRCLRLFEAHGFAVEIFGPAWWRRPLSQGRVEMETSRWLIAEKEGSKG